MAGAIVVLVYCTLASMVQIVVDGVILCSDFKTKDGRLDNLLGELRCKNAVFYVFLWDLSWFLFLLYHL